MATVHIAYKDVRSHRVLKVIADRINTDEISLTSDDTEPGKNRIGHQSVGAATCDFLLVVIDESMLNHIPIWLRFARIFNKNLKIPIKFDELVVQQIETGLNRDDCTVIPFLLDINIDLQDFEIDPRISRLGQLETFIFDSRVRFENDMERLVSVILDGQLSTSRSDETGIFQSIFRAIVPALKRQWKRFKAVAEIVAMLPDLIAGILLIGSIVLFIAVAFYGGLIDSMGIESYWQEFVSLFHSEAPIVETVIPTNPATTTETLPQATVVPTATETPLPTMTPNVGIIPTHIAVVDTATATQLATNTIAPTYTISSTPTSDVTVLHIPSATLTFTATATVTVSHTPSATLTFTATATDTPTPTHTYTLTATNTPIPPSPTPTPTATQTQDISEFGIGGAILLPEIQFIESLNGEFSYSPLIRYGDYRQCEEVSFEDVRYSCDAPGIVDTNVVNGQPANSVDWEDAEDFCEYVGGLLPLIEQLSLIHDQEGISHSQRASEWVRDEANMIDDESKVPLGAQNSSQIVFRCVRDINN